MFPDVKACGTLHHRSRPPRLCVKFRIKDTTPAVRKEFFSCRCDNRKNESKNSCFWVEGDLLLRTTSSPVMHVNFAGVYLNATGIVHAHGQSRNLEHVSLENSNEQRFYQSDFREALRTSASDLAEVAQKKDASKTRNEDKEANNNTTETSLYDAMRRRQRLNLLLSGPLNTTAYPSTCEFALKLFIEPGKYSLPEKVGDDAGVKIKIKD